MGNIDKEPDGTAVNKKDGYDLVFYKFIIDSLPVAVFTVNAEFKITGFNPWAEDVTGYSEKEVVGHYCSEILNGEMCEANCPLKSVIKSKKPVTQVETTIYNKQGNLIPVRMNTAALFDDDDKSP